jgi:uncharacterized protein YjbI with pentapeptide repeats
MIGPKPPGEGSEPQNKKWYERTRYQILLFAGGIVLFVLVGGLILDWYINPQTSGQKKDLVQALGLLTAGVAGAVGIYFTWRGQRLSRQAQEENQRNTLEQLEQSRNELEINREGQITDRFTKAIDQLGKTDEGGSKNLEMRLGGIYALERIAKESYEDHWPIMQVLTAYVQTNSHKHEKPQEDLSPPDFDIQAILTVIKRRKLFYKKGEPEPLDLQGADLRGSSALAKAHLEGAYLQEVDLRKADLEGAYLREARLRGADLQKANLHKADLHRDFHESNGVNVYEGNSTDLYQANLAEANLLEADLQGAYLESAHLEGASLAKANLVDTVFRRAWLQRTCLREANLEGANLQGADLQGADLEKANVQGADLREANLQGAKLQGASLLEADLGEANLQRTDLREANLQRANVFRANLQRANLQRADLQEANLQANLGQANLREANLREANLRGTHLSRANLRATDLRAVRGGLAQEQINPAYGDERTKLPEGLHAPPEWSKGTDDQTDEQRDGG